MNLIGGLLGGLLSLNTVAAAASVAPTVPDTLAQRVQACTTCHGEQGRAGPDGYYPRLAGKPAGYLYQQLVHFRDGRRQHRLMAHLLEPLSNAYLMEIAQHFSSLNLPYSPPVSSRIVGTAWARGQQLVSQGDPGRGLPACIDCHGNALTGVQPHIPGLLGLPRDYISAQMGAWRTGVRQAAEPDCMARIAQRLSLDDIAAVSAWLASQPVPADSRPALQPPKTMPLTCGTVHTPPHSAGARS